MLTECPECQLQVSDKAVTCPHCGYPLKTSVHATNRPFKKAHQRLPNGFGQITKISTKNLRKPYRAMVTAGKTEFGKPICKLLKPESYFETYNDAYKALIEYNKNPYDLGKDITIGELYNAWWNSNSVKRLSESTKKVYSSAWKYCNKVENMLLSEFKIRHARQCIEEAGDVSMTKKMIRTVLLRMFDYAVQYEYIDKNIIRDFKLEENITVKKNHITFTRQEMSVLWARTYMVFVDWVLIQCYTGLRPQELVNIKLSDVDLDKRVMYGGMKTKAGKNRAIPIHECIVDLIEKNIENSKKCGSEWMITYKNKKLDYNNYFYYFAQLMKALDFNPEHRPHDPRKQFITMAKEANVDEYAIKRIVGHKISDITENVYTERDIEWLVKEVNLIPSGCRNGV